MELPTARREGGGPHRSALVTGASTGIGLAFAERLARDHWDLVLVARDRGRLESLATRLRGERGVGVEVLPADLTQPVPLQQVEARIASDATLDLLVNNAGFGTRGPFAELDPEHEAEQVRLNVLALVRLTRAALGHMVSRGRGEIVNVSSLASFQPTPFTATYGATKAFVSSFTEALHEELRGTGVRVQALCPGFTRTEFQQRAGIDTGRIPDLAWMDADAVVEASLAGLARGDAVVVPGALNRTLRIGTTLLPRGVARRLGGIIGRRLE